MSDPGTHRNQSGGIKRCPHIYRLENGVPVARCTKPWIEKHDHVEDWQDNNLVKLVVQGDARYLNTRRKP